jgi:hypothetical protein
MSNAPAVFAAAAWPATGELVIMKKQVAVAILAIAGTVFAVGCGKLYSSSNPMPNAPSSSGDAPTAVPSSLQKASSSANGQSRVGFGFNAIVSGFRTGKVFVSGGGSFDLSTHVTSAGGGFNCIESVLQGPLSVSVNTNDPGACLSGEGVRWDTAALLDGTSFRCTGAQSEILKPVVADDHLVVLQSDFYRAGNGNNESFHAQMIVADHDIAPTDFPGVNVWVQGVGCGVAQSVNFSK